LQRNPPPRQTLDTVLRSIALPALAAVLALSSAAPAVASTTAPARPAHSAPAAPPLAKVLAHTFRAYGGVDAILSVGAVHSVGAVSQGEAHGWRVERTLALPDRYRSALSLGGVEHETVILAGPRAFRNGAEVTGLVLADQIRLEAMRAFVPGALARNRTALVDRGEVGKGAQRVRRVELPLREDASLVVDIDARSGRVVRTVVSVGGRGTQVSYRHFRMVSGVLFPFAEDVESADGQRTLALERIELVAPATVRIEAP
jgi:hypothetical protein